MEKLLSQYIKALKADEINSFIQGLLDKNLNYYNLANLKKAYSYIDLTSLNSTDGQDRIKNLCKKVSEFHSFPKYVGIPNVAAICVYPSLVQVARKSLNNKYVKIDTVIGFPSSQTFFNIKCQEAKQSISEGADEIDMVMNISRFVEGDYATVFNEIVEVRKEVGKTTLKVILETGALSTMQQVKDASILAMEAGADFIKTSTGKVYQPASKEAVYVMTMAIKEYYLKTGRKVGIKPSGGVINGKQACDYMYIIQNNLGNEWMNSELFRFGASNLANNLLTEISTLVNQNPTEIKYFDI